VGSAEGVAARAARMAALLGPAEISASAPPWWPGPPETGDGTTLVQVSFWVSALARVLDAIDAAARGCGVSPGVAGSAGAGVLYLRLGSDGADSGSAAPSAADPPGGMGGARGDGGREPPMREASPPYGGSLGGPPPRGDTARFVDALRSGLARERGGVVVLSASAAVREAFAGEGGMAGTVPALALMRAVKDQFDPGHRMAPGRFPEAM
jgi:glycolate oxidase FAD binding subunit